MTRRKFKSGKKTKLQDNKALEPVDFSYWDPYYVDSEVLERFPRDDDKPMIMESTWFTDLTNVIPYTSPTTPGIAGNSTAQTEEDFEQHLTPAIGLTAIFGALFIILPFFVKKGPNRGIIRCSIMITVFCMWIFWVTIYIGQMHPLMGPRMENTTVAWIAHKLGNQVERGNSSSSEKD